MSNIILAELLDVICKQEIVRIYLVRKYESEGYDHVCTGNPLDILEGSHYIFLVDSNLRVVDVSISEDPDYGNILDIVVKRIKNESK